MKLEIRDGHVVERVTHELTDIEAYDVRKHLAADGIPVVLGKDVDQVLHIWALAPMPTRDEVRALAAFRAVTDARLAFHAVPACPIHGVDGAPTQGCKFCARTGREAGRA